MVAAGAMGSSSALYHLRQVCANVNQLPLNRPGLFANAYAGGLDEQGYPTDPKLQQQLREQMAALLASWTQRLNAQSLPQALAA